MSVAVDASDWQFYAGGVLRCAATLQPALNHGVLAIGYGREADEDYWLIKNSWGTAWGDKGFIKVSAGLLYDCGARVQASYPVV